MRSQSEIKLSYLYHRVPDDLKGHILYPLNQLKSVYPSLYAAKSASYQNRETVMQARLPILDCLWNDVLHFSPVHPSKIQKARVAAGFSRRPRRYFEVDPVVKGLNAENAVIFLHQRVNPESFQLDDADFRVFNPRELKLLEELPESTLVYYKEMFANGKRPLTYLFVPHILYQGQLDIRDVKIIEVF
jgi:hypothetical protein